MLLGRREECAVLDRLLDGARAGRSSALVLEGEAGVGKTALLDYAIASASDLRVLRAVGVESEMELAFAALHQLCAPVLDRLDRLPVPQRDALLTTLGLAPARCRIGSRWSRSAEAPLGRGGPASASVRGRRRAVVRPGIGPMCGVRGTTAAGGVGPDVVRGA